MSKEQVLTEEKGLSTREKIVLTVMGTFGLCSKIVATSADMSNGMTFHQSFHSLHSGGLTELGAIAGACIIIANLVDSK